MDMLARIRGEMLPFAELLGIEFVSVAPDRICLLYTSDAADE